MPLMSVSPPSSTSAASRAATGRSRCRASSGCTHSRRGARIERLREVPASDAQPRVAQHRPDVDRAERRRAAGGSVRRGDVQSAFAPSYV